MPGSREASPLPGMCNPFYTLLRYASRKADDEAPPLEETMHFPTRGVGWLPTSPLLHMLAYLVLPLALVIAFAHMMFGHD